MHRGEVFGKSSTFYLQHKGEGMGGMQWGEEGDLDKTLSGRRRAWVIAQVLKCWGSAGVGCGGGGGGSRKDGGQGGFLPENPQFHRELLTRREPRLLLPPLWSVVRSHSRAGGKGEEERVEMEEQ